MNVKEYYINLQTALEKVDSVIREVESGITDEYAAINYPKVLTELNDFRRKILYLLAVHKFYRLSKEAFMVKTDSKNAKSIEAVHIVKDYETPIGIARKYQMTLEDLLKKNGLKTYQITTGVRLKVEIALTNEIVSRIFEDIPTFDSHEGELVFGKDLPNKLVTDSNGDLRVMDPQETLKQGILNRTLTRAGTYLYEEDFGIDNLTGKEFPTELSETFYLMKLSSQLLLDKRIKEIESLSITRNQNSINVDCRVKAINNQTVSV